ncbi:Unknown protein sequence [Pseudomonas syringae pv. maculicola]|nr:Unknown protein sequence [Pseudomonas syringae pv. maculicola]
MAGSKLSSVHLSIESLSMTLRNPVAQRPSQDSPDACV